jgi:hypothetical protein
LPDKLLNETKVAAFDTRIELSTIKSGALRLLVDKGGYAARHILKALKKKGGLSIADPEGFLVMDEKGPLKDGEIQRAIDWSKKLMDPAN